MCLVCRYRVRVCIIFASIIQHNDNSYFFFFLQCDSLRKIGCVLQIELRLCHIGIVIVNRSSSLTPARVCSSVGFFFLLDFYFIIGYVYRYIRGKAHCDMT